MGMSPKAMNMAKARMADRAGRAMMAPQPQMGMKKGGKAEYGMKKGGMAGGSFRKAADGIASKGKTKVKMVRMNYGGKC